MRRRRGGDEGRKEAVGVAREWSVGSEHTRVLLQQEDSSGIHLFLRQQLNGVLKVGEADVVETIPETHTEAQ